MTQDTDMGSQAQRKTHPQGAQNADGAHNIGVFSALHGHGYSVFPLRHQSERAKDGSKRPLFKWGKFQRKRVKTPVALRWDRIYSGHNVGVATGAISGIVVLDVDSAEGQDYADAHGLPRTPCVSTGKGRHYYFRHPGLRVGNWARKRGGMDPLPGLDFRGDGGYVLGAGCVHPTGAVYEWLVTPDECPYAAMPQWLLDYCQQQDGAATEAVGADTEQDAQKGTATGQTALQPYPDMASCRTDAELRSYVQGALKDEVRTLESMAPDSGRNNQLNTSAYNLGQLVGQGGLTQADVERALYAACVANQSVADDGPKVVRDTLASGLTAGMANPRIIAARDPGTGLHIERPPEQQPLQVNADGQLVGGDNPLTWRTTEVGNAERLLHHHGHQLRYNHTSGQWLVWDGTRWAPDAKGKARQIAKSTARGIVAEALQFADDRYRDLLRWAATSEKAAGIANMLSLAQTEPAVAVTQDMLDKDPFILNLLNGTLELTTGTFREHRQDDLLTLRAPVRYDPQAQCPTWLAFLQKIFNGDADLIFFLQQAVGYSLTADTSEQCFFLLWGSGQNGKSTLVNTLMYILGGNLSGYAQHTKYETVMAKRQDGVGDDLAMLDGARLVAAMEGAHGRALAESLVKQLTGGDPVTARFLYGRYFTFRPQFKLWLATNHKPVIKGTDLAIWRRVKLVPFTVTIPDAEKDPHLADKLQAEASGILNWAVAGFEAWQEKGLVTPAAVSAATAEYRSEMDALGDWLGECCEAGTRFCVHFADLYQSYSVWCNANNEHAQKSRTFREGLMERGYATVAGTGNRKVVNGLRLRTEDLFSSTSTEANHGG